MKFTAGLLATTANAIVDDDIAVVMKELLLTQQLLAHCVQEQFLIGSLSGVKTSAAATRGWLEALWDVLGEAEVVRTVDRLNARHLGPGHELVLGRWADGTNTSIRFLTGFRYASLCGRACGTDPAAAAPMHAALRGGDGSLRGPDYRPAPVYAGYMYLPAPAVGVVYKVVPPSTSPGPADAVRGGACGGIPQGRGCGMVLGWEGWEGGGGAPSSPCARG